MSPAVHDETAPASLPDLPSTQPRRGHVCAVAECETLVLFNSRFCDGCYADAAKDLARRIELDLIERYRFEPGSKQLKDAMLLDPQFRTIEWYETESILGKLYLREAVYLRGLTESACLLVSAGGVAALASLPGSRSHPETKPGVCDFAALPQFEETEPKAERMAIPLCQQQQRYNAYCAAVLLAMLMFLLAVRH